MIYDEKISEKSFHRPLPLPYHRNPTTTLLQSLLTVINISRFLQSINRFDINQFEIWAANQTFCRVGSEVIPYFAESDVSSMFLLVVITSALLSQLLKRTSPIFLDRNDTWSGKKHNIKRRLKLSKLLIVYLSFPSSFSLFWFEEIRKSESASGA
jgi:hypothetical protein